MYYERIFFQEEYLIAMKMILHCDENDTDISQKYLIYFIYLTFMHLYNEINTVKFPLTAIVIQILSL